MGRSSPSPMWSPEVRAWSGSEVPLSWNLQSPAQPILQSTPTGGGNKNESQMEQGACAVFQIHSMLANCSPCPEVRWNFLAPSAPPVAPLGGRLRGWGGEREGGGRALAGGLWEVLEEDRDAVGDPDAVFVANRLATLRGPEEVSGRARQGKWVLVQRRRRANKLVGGLLKKIVFSTTILCPENQSQRVAREEECGGGQRGR